MARTATHRAPDLCRCGHDADAHAHYRAGTECALCACPQWKRRRRRWRLVRRGQHAAFATLVCAGVVVIAVGLILMIGEGP